MGLFHFRYQANLRALLDALLVRKDHPDWDISVTCRCRSIFGITEEAFPSLCCPLLPRPKSRRICSAPTCSIGLCRLRRSCKLRQVQPLHQAGYVCRKWLAHSVSRAGRYRGRETVAGHDAAVTATTLDPQEIARLLIEAMQRRDTIVSHALRLARERFMLADQQRRFWTPIRAVLEGKAPPPRKVLQAQG